MEEGPHAVVGFWLSTVEADVASVAAADAAAATAARFEALRRADGTLPSDWFYVATFTPEGTPELAAVAADHAGEPTIGPPATEELGGAGEPVWVVGLTVSTAAARLIRLARPQPLEAVESVLDQSAGDLQFVAALDGANRPLHTCEGFDVEAIRLAAGA